MNKTLRAILFGLLILIAIAGYGVAVVETHYALVSPWYLVAIFLAGAIGLALRLGRQMERVTGYRQLWLNRVICTAISAGVISGLVFFINDFAAAENTVQTECVSVERTYHETRHRTKRVGRRYTRSEPYTVSVIDLRFSDGRVKSVNVPAGVSRRFHRGDSVEVSVVRGFFGIPLFRYPEIFKTKKL